MLQGSISTYICVGRINMECIFAKIEGKYQRINFNDINWFEITTDAVLVDTPDKRFPISVSLQRLENVLPSDVFQKTHQNFIVNLRKIKAINGNVLYTENGDLPMGKDFRDHLISHLNLL